MRYTLIILIITLTIISACNKEIDHLSLDYGSAIQLKIGNYWVYNSRTIILGTNGIIENLLDSIYIRKDTVVRGKVYSIIENDYGLFGLQRDSLKYLINEHNEIGFSGTNFIDTLFRKPPALGFMKKIEEDITVPAGTFKAISWIILEKVANQDNLNDPAIYEDNNQFRVLSRTWYAKNIGIVKSVFYYGGVAFEKRLQKYNVNN